MEFPKTWDILIRKASKMALQGGSEAPVTHHDSRLFFPLSFSSSLVSAQCTGLFRSSLMEWLNACIN